MTWKSEFSAWCDVLETDADFCLSTRTTRAAMVPTARPFHDIKPTLAPHSSQIDLDVRGVYFSLTCVHIWVQDRRDTNPTC